ncbi:centromere protein Chl4/mis15/CENP-N [Apodospora peruviana]|uniref:Centromere protein Chl4/mis15/CENP-N n=1 Tax=Apodospora peruviana TaxID=516989 RepID=A0AAE0M1M4_9PEZI|nr:centromere protein Chl4/mis15/CENP-N [Apodospora peruviana]
MPRISIPTAARLPSALRVEPSNPAVSKILSRLSRTSLVSVALDWLDDKNLPLAAPYLHQQANPDDSQDDDGLSDDDDFNPPARSLAALRELYGDLQTRKGSKREVLDRIIEGDWRHGLSLYQLAMADLQYLYDHPTSQKWSAYRIVALKTPSPDAADNDSHHPQEVDKESLTIPRFHPSTFLKSLQATVLPDVKAHYNFDRHKTLPLLLLRIFILDSPYNTNLAVKSSSGATSFDTSRTVYIAFPDASPFIYISKPQALSGSAPAGGGGTGESNSLRTLIVEGIPKALSRPRQRFTLKSTNLSTKNLEELLDKRGSARTNSAGGGWSIYADEKVKESPLDTVLPSPPLSDREEAPITKKPSPPSREDEEEQRTRKRMRLVAKARFGDSSLVDDSKGVERVDIILEDAFPSVASTTKRKRHQSGVEEEDNHHNDDRRRRTKTGGSGRKSNFEVALGDDELHGEEEAEEAGEGKWTPNVRLTFHGSHVFAGIRQLVERGIIDGERMPGWMTGEEGVTVGAVRNGRIRGHKGAGL